MTAPHHSVIARTQISAAERDDLAQLVDVCLAHEHIDLRLNWSALQRDHVDDDPSDFLCYHADQLVGFLALDGLGDDEAEAAGLVHPAYRRRGVFRALVAAARAACAQAKTEALLLVADRASAAAQPCAAALGAAFSRAEHKMGLAARPHAARPFALDFAPATQADAPAIAQIMAADDGSDPRGLVGFVTLMMLRRDQQYYVARRAGAPIGMVRIETIDAQRYIYGFVVVQAERGKGYGREILLRTLDYAFAGYNDQVLLEVDETNVTALNLYRSLGFQILCTYDYYRLPAADR